MEVRGVLDFHRILKLQIQHLVIVKAFHIVIYEYIAKSFRGVSMYGYNRFGSNELNYSLQRLYIGVTARMDIFDSLAMLLGPISKTLGVGLIPVATPYRLYKANMPNA